MAATAGPDIVDNGLVLALDAADFNSFKGEATTNYYTTPETLTDGRVGTTSGGTYTDFTTGGPSDGRFTRWTNNTGTSGTTAWHWSIGYTNTGLTTGQTLTVSFYARCPNGTLSNITLNSPDSIAINATLDSTWRRYSGQIIYGGDYTSTPFIRINRSNSNSFTNGATYDIANIQIETKSYATTFTTGTRGTTVATGGGWADLTIAGNNGELINGARESSTNRGELLFDGTDDYISIPNSASINPGTGSFTIIVWANSDPSNAGDGWDLWVAKRSNGSNGYYLGVNNPLGVRFMLGNDANSRTDTGYVTYTYNTWAMYTAILDRNANTQTIIKNNYEEISTVTPSGGNYYNTNPLSIGADIGINAFYVNGRVSNVKIYNRALTATEVQQNFNESRSRFGI